MRVRPFAMKGFAPWLVHPFKRVAAKKVPLRLGQIGGQTCTAVGIKVRQRSTHGRAGNAGRDAQGDHAAPRGLATVDFVGKFGIDQQRRQIWIAFKGLSDAVQETGCKRSQRSRRNREGTERDRERVSETSERANERTSEREKKDTTTSTPPTKQKRNPNKGTHLPRIMHPPFQMRAQVPRSMSHS